MPYCFSRSFVKFQGYMAKTIFQLLPQLGASGLKLQFQYTDGYEMMHEACSSIKNVP